MPLRVHADVKVGQVFVTVKPDIGGLSSNAVIRFVGVVGVASPQFLGHVLGQRFGFRGRLHAEMQQARGYEVEPRQSGYGPHDFTSRHADVVLQEQAGSPQMGADHGPQQFALASLSGPAATLAATALFMAKAGHHPYSCLG